MFTEKNPKICGRCPYASHPFVPGTGPKDAKLFVLARDPGDKEEQQGVPLVGLSGQVWSRCSSEVGVDPESTYRTNVVKCRPPDNDATTKDWAEAAKLCSRYLNKELERSNARVVLAMGNEALRSVVSGVAGGITRHRGSVFKRDDGKKVVAAFHPAYILRNPNMLPIYLQDLDRARQELGSKRVLTEGTKGFKHHVIRTMSEFKKMMKKLDQASEVIFDVETDKLEWWSGKVICLGICFEDNVGYVIPFRTYRVEEKWFRNKKTKRRRRKKIPIIEQYWSDADFDYIKRRLNRVAQNSNIRKGGQNFKFDAHHCANDGINIDLENSDDTMVMQHLVDENSPRDLKTMVALYAPHMAGYEKKIRADKEETGTKNLVAVDPETLYEYCAGDVVGTRAILPILRQKMQEESVHDFYHQHSVPLLAMLFDAERRGVLIGAKEFRPAAIGLRKEIRVVERRLRKLAGRDFSPSKPPEVSHILFVVRGLPPLEVSKKTKKPSTAKAVLQQLAEEYGDPFAAEMLKWRQLSKLYSTYIKGLKKRLDANNRLHTTFKSTGTVTGRLSSAKPNLQNIPRKGPIKELFIADPGYQLIVADLSQAELRVAAILAGDEAMIEAFNKGADPHSEVACLIFKKKAEDVTEEERVIAKSVNFGVLYGKSEDDTADDIGISQEEMREHFNLYWATFFRLRRWIESVKRRAKSKKYIVNVFGRKRRFNPEAASERRGGIGHLEREAVNCGPQSTASDWNCRAGVRIRKKFKKLQMDACVVLLVHDSIFALVKNKHVPKACRIMIRELSRPVPELDNYKFVAKIGVGRSWAEANKNQASLEEAVAAYEARRSA